MTKLLSVAILALVAVVPTVAPANFGTSPGGESTGSWPGLSPPGGASAHFEYRPVAPDARAVFLRHSMAHAKCVIYDIQFALDLREPDPVPRVMLAATWGNTTRIGETMVDQEKEWTISMDDELASSHTMVNVTVGNASLIRRYEMRNVSYQGVPYTWIELEWGTCPTFPSDLWLSAITTARAHNLTVTVDFYDRISGTDYERGAAWGTLTHVAESNRTFVKKLRDFQGTASYNGDPLGVGRSSAAGLNLELPIDTRHGFVGGIDDLGYGWTQRVFSYRGPGGTIVVEPAGLRNVVGGPGRSTFGVHAYTSPETYSGLYAWGADIDAGLAPLLALELP